MYLCAYVSVCLDSHTHVHTLLRYVMYPREFVNLEAKTPSAYKLRKCIHCIVRPYVHYNQGRLRDVNVTFPGSHCAWSAGHTTD